MKTYQADNFDKIYKDMMFDLLYFYQFQSAPRAMKINERLNVSYELFNVDNDKIDFLSTNIPDRQATYDRYAAAEHEWYMSGNLKAESAPSKFWLKIADSNGNIVSNYGYMMLYKKIYGDMTPLEKVIDTLTKDRDSRQAVAHFSLPEYFWDGNKDLPCTLITQYFIREDRLFMTITQRSCDIIKGLSYDERFHVWCIKYVAEKLGVKCGTLTHNIGSLHLYENDIELAKRICKVN